MSFRPALVIAVCMLVEVASAAAQQSSQPQQARPASDTTRAEAAASAIDPSLLDTPINRATYPLGPGDVVALAIIGDRNDVFTLTVSPEGTLLIPGIGIAPVLGDNLNTAEDEVRQMVARLYRNVQVRLALSKVRSFKVFLVGAVENPGVRVATAATRVSELVDPVAPDGTRRRSVRLSRAEGDTIDVDLVRFVQTGDISANPALREGDAIIVPGINERVTVEGRVWFPGIYEYRSGETLMTFLRMANGGADFPVDAADTLRLVRFDPSGRRTDYAISRADAVLGRGIAAAPLQRFDVIFVPTISNFRYLPSAHVTGQVRNPGTYPIREDTTTVRDLIEMAGGFTTRASLTDATLSRRRPPASEHAMEELRRRPPELLTSHERRLLDVYADEGSSGRVVIDFRRLFEAGGEAYNQTVRNGDVLNVPERRGDISVIGAVRQPGLMTLLPNMRVSQSIALAGGFARRADRDDVTVLRARTGTRVDASDVTHLEAGDAVVVPYREDRDYLRLLQGTNAVVGTVTGLILTAVAVFRWLEQ